MKTLKSLKHLINFSFLIFIASVFFVFIQPFFDTSYTQIDKESFFWITLFFVAFHMGIIFMILFYLRKFIINSIGGNPLDKSTRNCLKIAGIFCLIYGAIRIYEVSGIFAFYRYGGEINSSLITDGILHFGSLCFTWIVGLFFIYLSIVLEESEVLKQENQLTI